MSGETMEDTEDYKLNAPYTMWNSSVEEWDEGVLFSPLGMVHIYCQGRGTDCDDATVFQCVANGRRYTKQTNKSYKRQGLSILAHKFLKEILAVKPHRG